MGENKYTGLEVAVIGLSCRFPGADNWRTYWDNLVNGREFVDRTFNSADKAGNGKFVPARVVLEKKDLFDADFFDYRPDEAALMNPLHRIFHACVWEALEDAGYATNHSNFLTGLFAGGNENLNWKLYSLLKNDESAIDAYTLDYLNSRDYLSSLIAYKLNLRGPVVSVNTACSTSLVAVNMAYKSLLLGESDIALAGGISLVTQPQYGYYYEEGMIASKDGYCRAFDKDASGTIRGEGGGIVVLKRLQDALRDRDSIYAIIKGGAINNDGKQKVGFTAPAVEGQAECIRRALKFSKVAPESVTLIEAHGTGTRLGDVIEIEALNKAYRSSGNHRCAIGSVKTNMGHLDTAAGIAGFIKAVLALKFRAIPPSLHCIHPNPEIAFQDGPFYVNTKLTPWKTEQANPLRAGVSSFGIGGTNAHMILEEPPAEIHPVVYDKHYLLTVSARSENSLNSFLNKMFSFLTTETEVPLHDLCYTLREGRRDFEYRKSIVFSTKENLMHLLQKGMNEPVQTPVSGKSLPLVLLFPGQGSQYLQMGRGLYESNPVFRELMDKGFAELERLSGENFKAILYPDESRVSSINDTRYTQPLLFLVEYALARLIIEAGLKPACLTGHSIGEYTAAAISGVFSFSDALKIVNLRADIISRTAGGAMLSAAIREEMAAHYLSDMVSLAAVNGPEQVVFSGTFTAISSLAEQLERDGVTHALLKVSHAFHSVMLDPALEEFREAFKGVQMNAPSIPFISNVTGKLIGAVEATSADYWVRHLRHTVRFYDGMQTVRELLSGSLMLETGPGKILSNLIAGYPFPDKYGKTCHLLRNKYNPENDHYYFLQQAGRLWEEGLRPQWSILLGTEKGRRIPLPTYAFDAIQYPTEVTSSDEQKKLIRSGSANAETSYIMKQGLYYPSWTLRLENMGHIDEQVFLFFSNGDDLSVKLSAALKKSGKEVVEIQMGDEYDPSGKMKYVIRPGNEADYEKMYAALRSIGFVPTDIIYQWGTTEQAEKEKSGNGLLLSFMQMTYCIRNLKIICEVHKLRFVLLTKSLYRITGNEQIMPHQSVLNGMLPSIQHEYNMFCRNIDYTEEISRGRNLATFINELCSSPVPGGCTGIRYEQRWDLNFQPLQNNKDISTVELKKGGTYLITGGLGNAGYTLSKFLLEKFGATLIVTGREKIDALKAKGEASQKFERWEQLSSYGDHFFYYMADSADLIAVKEMAGWINNKYGTLDGIIHAAGITDNSYFDFTAEMSPANVRMLFAPKVKGVENIYEAFSKYNPGFVWITSSISSITGGLGFGAYAAANAFVNHLLTSRFTENVNWTSICLPELAFTESEIAGMPMAVNPSELCELFSRTAGKRISPVLYYTKRPLTAFKGQFETDPQRDVITTRRQHVHLKLKQRHLISDYVIPQTETEKRMAELFSEFFGIERIGSTDNFFDIGGDSLKGMVLLKKINAAFGVKLQLADFLENPDIRSLAQKADRLASLNTDDSQKFEIVL